MPTYEFKCQDCGVIFSKVILISRRSENQIICDACGSKNVEQLYTSISVKTDKKTW